MGFPKNSRLNTRFVELPVNPSVLRFDGVLTRNSAQDPIKRILVGRYNDLQFGNIEARGYANIAPPIAVGIVPSTATFDSLVLQLKLDDYYYGNSDSTQQRIQIFEVLDTIKSTIGYYSSSSVSISSTPLGEAKFSVDPAAFDKALPLNSDRDTSNNVTTNVRIKLQGALGPNLLADLMSDPQTLISDPDAFMGKYKGLAFVMAQGDKIIGIDPTFTSPFPKGKDTKLSLYYTDGTTRSRADFLFFFANNFTYGKTYPAVSFTTITTDRNSTALSGIQGFKDFVPPDDHFYVQSGTALLTKIDLTSFYNYVDTLENVVFNSAELVVTNTSKQKSPAHVQLRILDSTNHFRSPYMDSLVNDVITSTLSPYFAKIPTAWFIGTSTTGASIEVRADQGPAFAVATDTHEVGKIFITEFCQQIFRHKHDKRRIKTLALMAVESEFQKSVNGLVLDRNISLRLYYSKPVSKIR